MGIVILVTVIILLKELRSFSLCLNDTLEKGKQISLHLENTAQKSSQIQSNTARSLPAVVKGIGIVVLIKELKKKKKDPKKLIKKAAKVFKK